MKDEKATVKSRFHPSALILHPFTQTTCLISATT